MRGGSPREIANFAVDAWEKIASRDRVIELATKAMSGATASDVIARLRREALAYLNDCAQIDPVARKTIAAARELLNGAIDAVTRHS
jgi:hypothetical protein